MGVAESHPRGQLRQPQPAPHPSEFTCTWPSRPQAMILWSRVTIGTPRWRALRHPLFLPSPCDLRTC